MSTFGDRVRSLRKATGLNQPELAEKVGVTKGLISQIEKGQVSEVKMLLLYKLATALSVSARFLATGRGSPIPLGQISVEEAELIESFRHCAPQAREHLLTTGKLLAGKKEQVLMVETPIGAMHR